MLEIHEAEERLPPGQVQMYHSVRVRQQLKKSTLDGLRPSGNMNGSGFRVQSSGRRL